MPLAAVIARYIAHKPADPHPGWAEGKVAFEEAIAQCGADPGKRDQAAAPPAERTPLLAAREESEPLAAASSADGISWKHRVARPIFRFDEDEKQFEHIHLPNRRSTDVLNSLVSNYDKIAKRKGQIISACILIIVICGRRSISASIRRK